MKKVSIIVATYNGEKTIEATLDSIFNQWGLHKTFELEVLLVDDHSTDHTVAIAQKFPIILYRNAQNSGGPNKGRNIGLTKATGDYICIADQDDLWMPYKIATLLPYLEKVPIVSSGYTVVDNVRQKSIHRIQYHPQRPYLYFGKNQTFMSKLTKSLKGQNTYLGSLMFDKSLNTILFEEQYGMVDFDWVLRLFHQQDSIEAGDSLYSRLVNASNLSLNAQYRQNDFNYGWSFIKRYKSLYPKAVKQAHRRMNGSMARYYYLIGDMKSSRAYFLKSEVTLKTILYFLTSFYGHQWVRKKFNIFG